MDQTTGILKDNDSWLVNYYERVREEYQFSMERKDKVTDWSIGVFFVALTAYSLIIGSQASSLWRIYLVVILLCFMVRFYFGSCVAYAYLKKWRYLLDLIEKYRLNNAPKMDFVKKEIEELHHSPKTTEKRRYFLFAQLKAGFFLMFLIPIILLIFELFLFHDAQVFLPIILLIAYCLYECIIFARYKNIDIRETAKSLSTASSSNNSIPTPKPPQMVEERVDTTSSPNNSQNERAKERILSKLDGLFTLLISLSTFLIGIAVSQRVSLGLNTILWYPLIGIVVTMIVSFILGIKGMLIAHESITNRMLAYCLLLSLPIWLIAVPILMIISPILNSLELIGVVFLTGFLLSLITFLLSKKLIDGFTREFPYIFIGEENIFRKVRKRIIPYVIIILAIATIITTVIILVSFQSVVQDIINNLPTPSVSPAP